MLLFDDSLSHKTQNNQLGIYIRYFDETWNQIKARYIDTAFIGHSIRDHLLNHFLESTRKLHLNRLIKLSMDGPNGNWAFYEKLCIELKVTTIYHLLTSEVLALLLSGTFWPFEIHAQALQRYASA